MPHSATLEQIKAYKKKLRKGEILPDDLPPCSRCELDSIYFKEHAYRERQFLLVIKTIVTTIRCSLLRYKCPGCGKTYPYYPLFSLPYKRYVVDAFTEFTQTYVENDKKTYIIGAMIDRELPAYPESEKTLAPSSIHRWVTTLSRLETTCQEALSLILQKDPMSAVYRDLAYVTVKKQKYKSQNRKKQLLRCRRLLNLEAVFKKLFGVSIFTKLATRNSFI